MIKNVFVNPLTGTVRAGWRMLVFGCALFAGGAGENLLLSTVRNYLGPAQSYVAQTLFVVIILGATWLSLFIFENRPLKDVGLPLQKRSFAHLGWGVLAGGGMITVVFVVETAFSMTSRTLIMHDAWAIAGAFGASIALFSVAAFAEEILFRGYLFQTLTAGSNKWIATSVFALIFGAAHLANAHVTVFSVVNIALAGVWLSVAYYESGALWFPFGLHFGWNFFQHWYAFPVSGGSFNSIRVFALEQSGPSWLTGGAFGPEGGAFSTVVLVVSIGILLKCDLFGRKIAA